MTWWEVLHLDMALLVAGFSGGVVAAFVLKQSDPWSIMGSIVVGALTANLLGVLAAKWTGTPDHVAAFIVGICGMGVAKGVMVGMQKWRPFSTPTTENRDG